MMKLCRSVPFMVSLLLLSLLSKSSNKIFALKFGGNNGSDSARRKSPVHTASSVTKSFPNDDPLGSGASDHQIAQRQRYRRLNAVSFVSIANVFINSFRPDENIAWQMKLPRICWEVCIWIVAQSAKGAPNLFLLLSLMLGVTATIDIFVWGPVFGFFTSFEKCSGGWLEPKVCVMDYYKGLSGLLAMFQSIFGGFFYLAMAIDFLNSFAAIRIEYKVERQKAAMIKVLESQKHGVTSGASNRLQL